MNAQERLLAIVETWHLNPMPEFRGFRCAECQEYFSDRAWHHWLHEEKYITPVHFCEKCHAGFEEETYQRKTSTPVDREQFKPTPNPIAAVTLDKIFNTWNVNVEPVLKNFTCDACMKPLDIVGGIPQGYHLWRKKGRTLIEYHFHRGCGEEILK